MSHKTVTVQRGSVDYLDVEIDSLAPTSFISAPSLVGSTVRLAIVATGATPTWRDADWVGTPTTEGLARTDAVVTWSAANFAGAVYNIYAEITSGSEVHIEPAGTIKIREF